MGSEDVNDCLIQTILENNEFLSSHVIRRISDAAARMQIRLLVSADRGMNHAIMNDDGILAQSAEFEVLKKIYELTRIKQWAAQYDQLVYTLIFWNGKGWCGVKQDEPMQGPTRPIRKIVIYLMFEQRDYFLHAFEKLREEFICSVSGPLLNMSMNDCEPLNLAPSPQKTKLEGLTTVKMMRMNLD
jgi:hypothetical protein